MKKILITILLLASFASFGQGKMINATTLQTIDTNWIKAKIAGATIDTTGWDMAAKTWITNLFLLKSDTSAILLTQAMASSTFEPKVDSGTQSQYYRGDKTWQTLPTSESLWLRVVGSTNDIYSTNSGDAVINGVTAGKGKYTNYGTSTAFGVNALKANAAASNTAFGYNSMYRNTGGSGDVAFGANTLGATSSGNYNTAIGVNSLTVNTGSNNTGVGAVTLESNSSGVNNTGVGSYSLNSNHGGSNNTATGYRSIFFNTTGYSNTSIGIASLYSNSTGHNNVAIGDSAGYSYNSLSNRVYVAARDSSTSGIYGDKTSGKDWWRVNGTWMIKTIPTAASTPNYVLAPDNNGLIQKYAWPTGVNYWQRSGGTVSLATSGDTLAAPAQTAYPSQIASHKAARSGRSNSNAEMTISGFTGAFNFATSTADNTNTILGTTSFGLNGLTGSGIQCNVGTTNIGYNFNTTSFAPSSSSGATMPTLGTVSSPWSEIYGGTGNSTNWNTAFGWGNHASAGYLTTGLAASTYQTILTNPVTGSGTAGYVPYYSGATAIGNSGLWWDAGNGRLGIGVTSPEYALHIGGDIYVSSTVYAGTSKSVAISSTSITSATNGILTIGNRSTEANSALSIKTKNIEAIKIDQNQQVGIGTTAPATLLHVNGTSTLPTILGGSAVDSYITYKSTSGSGTSSAIGHKFVGGADGNTTIMTMLNDGKVGIGRTDPGLPLDVQGNARFNGYVNALSFAINGTTAFSQSTTKINIGSSSWTDVLFNNTRNLGIGTTAPLVKLDVAGGVRHAGTDTTGVGSTATVGTIQYYNGHFYGLIPGTPPAWKQLDN